MSFASRSLSRTQILAGSAAVAVFVPILFSRRVRRLIGSYISRWRLRVACEEEGETRGQVSDLFVHPVKSFRAVPVSRVRLDSLGVEGDRRLMVVWPRPPPAEGPFLPGEATHHLLTQRQAPSLTSITASLPIRTSADKNHPTIIALSSHDSVKTIKIDISPNAIKSYTQHYRTIIWDDTVEVADVGDEAAAFLQQIVRKDDESFQDARLVTILPTTNREVCRDNVTLPSLHSGKVPQIALVDEFPILIACEKSLIELNRRLVEKGKNPIPMSRFRPNIVIRDTEYAFEEDHWKVIRIGDVIFHTIQGCPRCKQSCIDQDTGERNEEPLETLKEFRAVGEHHEDVYFGTYAIVQGEMGVVNVGDSVQVLQRGEFIG